MQNITRRAALACAFVVFFTAVGCENPGGGGAGKRGADRGTFAAGKAVPKDATMVKQSTHGPLIHRAQRPESVWVQDATTGKVIYSGPVRADSNVVVDPNAGAVAVNDIQVRYAGRLDPSHTYRLYFKER